MNYESTESAWNHS